MSRPYVALDANFPEDDKVVRAGESAAWLYVVMACDCRLRRTDGRLPKARVPRLNVPGWQRRLSVLMSESVGLVQEDGDDLVLPAYLKWNRSEARYREESQRKREAACARWHDQPCSRCSEQGG